MSQLEKGGTVANVENLCAALMSEPGTDLCFGKHLSER